MADLIKRIMAWTPVLIILLAAGLAACDGSSSVRENPNGDDPFEPPTSVDLRPESELTPNCYNWPADEFTPSNVALTRVALAEGERAIEFTLADPDGTSYKLSELLETKPVLMVFGAYT